MSMDSREAEQDMDIQYLKGVGPTRAKVLSDMGIATPSDLLNYFPRDWSFPPDIQKIAQLKSNQEVTIAGIIESIDFLPFRRPAMLEIYIADSTARCRAIWFNAKYLQKQLDVGQYIIAWGKVKEYKHQLQLSNPKFKILQELPQDNTNELSGAVYPATAKLSSPQIARIIKPLVEDFTEDWQDFFDDNYRKNRDLVTTQQAYRWIHLAKEQGQVDIAKRRLKYDELFLMQTALAVRRHRSHNYMTAKQIVVDKNLDSRIRRRFPFLLTGDQSQVIDDIVKDLSLKRPMNRLLQGDVGSGKTVVALYAALAAVANKSQAVIMAPTEILAQQHFLSMEKYLKGSKVKRAIITGGLTGAKRKKLLDSIEAGGIDIVVGTIALLQGDIKFKEMGLVVIDEQHKFGVHQRATLRKDHCPHCLVMTATPIPRTLAMTAFGDLDVSVIKNRPPGRGAVVTRWVDPKHRIDAFNFIAERLKIGRQAFFVYPKISNIDDGEQIKAAADEYKKLSEGYFKDFKVGLLHGQLKSAEKKQIMDNFRAGKIQLLVSTVVIEVGVDVPNATMMVIETADRFGLATLHQLRGRIGRGENKSYCFLFSETDNEIAKQRLDVMTRSNDGFEIAEHDLRLRGPGEMFSARQHGLPDLKFASIIDDYDLLQMSRRDAFEIIKNDPSLRNHIPIRKALIDKFEGKIELVDIG